MLTLIPFLRGRPKLRTWCAMAGASAATLYVQGPVGYVAIDALAAVVVISRPAGLAQKAIGTLFALMMIFDLVYALTARANPELFYNSLIALGWVQWAILGAWIGHDYVGRYLRWASVGNGPPAAVRDTFR